MTNKSLSRVLGRNVMMKPEIDTRMRFYARWKQHVIDVEREGPGKFYIRVTGPDGSYAYDGWWNQDCYTNMEFAVAEAIKGACILTDSVEKGVIGG